MSSTSQPRSTTWKRVADVALFLFLMLGLTIFFASLQSVSNRTATAVSGSNSGPWIGLATLGPQSDDATEPANGAAPAPVKPKQGINLFSLLTQGGWFMVPLLALSIAVGTIAIERYLALRREKVFPTELVDELSQLSASPAGLDPRRAYQACQRFPSSASYVLRSMLVKVGRPQVELETAASEAAQREATRLAQTTSWLALAAAVAPLIGLLGTVWGITQAFYDTTQMDASMNRGVALATGIYVALVTTMVGLMIAIPSAVLSHYYENRIVSLLNEIEEMVFNLMPQFERYEGQVRFTAGVSGTGTAPSSESDTPIPESSNV